THHVVQTHWFAAKLWEWQLQAALSLVVGVVDDDDMAAAFGISPCVGNEVIPGPVVGPGRQRLDQRPGAVAKRTSLLQDLQQPCVEAGNFRARRLNWA